MQASGPLSNFVNRYRRSQMAPNDVRNAGRILGLAYANEVSEVKSEYQFDPRVSLETAHAIARAVVPPLELPLERDQVVEGFVFGERTDAHELALAIRDAAPVAAGEVR